jgi:hypothetical protein
MSRGFGSVTITPKSMDSEGKPYLDFTKILEDDSDDERSGDDLRAICPQLDKKRRVRNVQVIKVYKPYTHLHKAVRPPHRGGRDKQVGKTVGDVRRRLQKTADLVQNTNKLIRAQRNMAEELQRRRRGE